MHLVQLPIEVLVYVCPHTIPSVDNTCCSTRLQDMRKNTTRKVIFCITDADSRNIRVRINKRLVVEPKHPLIEDRVGPPSSSTLRLMIFSAPCTGLIYDITCCSQSVIFKGINDLHRYMDEMMIEKQACSLSAGITASLIPPAVPVPA